MPWLRILITLKKSGLLPEKVVTLMLKKRHLRLSWIEIHTFKTAVHAAISKI